ncbi:hypothetical protein DIPPA_07812, partial [Diplonema papillatum]
MLSDSRTASPSLGCETKAGKSRRLQLSEVRVESADCLRVGSKPAAVLAGGPPQGCEGIAGAAEHTVCCGQKLSRFCPIRRNSSILHQRLQPICLGRDGALHLHRHPVFPQRSASPGSNPCLAFRFCCPPRAASEQVDRPRDPKLLIVLQSGGE